MIDLLPRSRVGLLGICCVAVALPASAQREAPPTITAEGLVTTRSTEGDVRTHASGAFVRWGEPSESRGRWIAELADGSRLVLYPAWTRRASVTIGPERVELRGETLTPIDAPRSVLRRLLVKAADDALLLSACTEPGTPSGDLLWTSAGDRLEGRLVSVEDRLVKFEVAGQPLELPLAEIASLRLAGADQSTPDARYAVGLRDGSLLMASQAVADAAGLRLKLACGVQATSDQADVVGFLQTLSGRFRYLSDARPVDYVQTPYLSITWPFAQDQALTGGPLRVAGVRRIKGLACHSASRMIYKLNPEDRRFRCEAALQEGAGVGGSVVFGVLAVRNGKFERLFESPIVRPAEGPIAIDVDVSGAQGLALVVDYADFGDQSDHAAWADARLEQ